MGDGSWSSTTYAATRSYNASKGIDDFAYTVDINAGRTAAKVNDALNPFGVAFRESRDSIEHPNSLPIVVACDVTGSMKSVPRIVMQKLPALFGLMLRDGRITDPQVMFAGIGDGTCDRSAFQVGQFESDNRAEEQLGLLYLEGGGGGQMTESYELLAYFLARHTELDSVIKRGKKGYLFIIGDENPYPSIDPRLVKTWIGDDLGERITTAALFEELKQKFEVFYILPKGTSFFGNSDVLRTWKKLLGQNVISLDSLDDLCATIAQQIALGEDAIDYDEAQAELLSMGVKTALVKVGTGSPKNVVLGSTPTDLSGDDSLARL